MAFRRVLISSEDKMSEIKTALDDFMKTAKFKSESKGVKITFKPSVKKDTLVIDVNGDGGVAVAIKLKDVARKYKADVKIKNEIGLVKAESIIRKLIRKEINETIQRYRNNR